MTTLLHQAIEELGVNNIKEIGFNICNTNVIKGKSVEDILKEHCGIYTIFIRTKDGKFYGDVAYMHVSVAKKFIEEKKGNSNWRGRGTYQGIPLFEELTGGECIFCHAKREKISMSKTLDYIEEIYSKDCYYSYSRPDLKEVMNLKQKFHL
ncbi:MAG: hypothetical protein WC916_02985 [Candidatus Woesearchaeota archaeon]